MDFQRPIFVIGMNRSGTTLLSSILDAHSRIAFPYESHFIVQYYKNLHLFNNLQTLDDKQALVSSILNEYRVRNWDKEVTFNDVDLSVCKNYEEIVDKICKAYAHKHGKDIWGDKSPSNMGHIATLHKIFPKRKFIHIIRDGRDVAISAMSQGWWSGSDFISHLKDWKDKVTLTRRQMRELPPTSYFEIKYEDFVLNPEFTVKKIIEFLGLAYEKKRWNYTK